MGGANAQTTMEGADKTEKGTKEVVEDRGGDGVVEERYI